MKADTAADDKVPYKKDDFFDELSRETREGGPGRSWLSEQRKLDMETFGMVRNIVFAHGGGFSGKRLARVVLGFPWRQQSMLRLQPVCAASPDTACCMFMLSQLVERFVRSTSF